jgi:phage tail protein X
MVRGLWATPLTTLIGVVLCLVLSAGLAVGAYIALDDDDTPIESESLSQGEMSPSALVSASPSLTQFPTNTRPAPPLLPTVTPQPPTDTPTPTPGPCIKTAQAGDTIYGLAYQCGHRHMSIVPLIVENNIGLDCETCLREGQVLEIPWPTPTEGPPETSNLQQDTSGGTVDQMVGDAMVAQVSVNEFGTPDRLATVFVEPTLRPGLAWHYINQDETLISVINLYNTDAKAISDLNPEVDFRQCDFGMRYGGEKCNVMLFIGQRLRVPAPTPLPTIPPTPSGSETPTPSPTPTFNVPAAFLPEEGAFFDAFTLVTLHWTTSGSLGPNERYLVTVRNLDSEQVFQELTEEVYFVLPGGWQATDGKTHKYEWVISIATIDGNQVTSTRQPTTPRRFEWQGR